MAALLEIEEMSTGYAGVPVVRELNLHVDEGEVVALLGPNGAGKTTTLLTTSALVPILAGDIKVFGRSVKGRRPHLVARDGLAHVPEDRSLFFGLTVKENLRLGAAKGSADIDQALAYFPALKPILSRRAGLLSGGEQQMLAMGRALTVRPRLLMVDEMSLGLAPIIVERLLPVLRTIADETGAGVLVVEQHVHLALEVADRAYVLSHGNLALEGSAAELSENRHLLESSYMGQSEIAAAEEEQEEIEQQLEPSGGAGRGRHTSSAGSDRVARLTATSGRRPPGYLAGLGQDSCEGSRSAVRRAAGRRPSDTARSPQEVQHVHHRGDQGPGRIRRRRPGRARGASTTWPRRWTTRSCESDGGQHPPRRARSGRADRDGPWLLDVGRCRRRPRMAVRHLHPLRASAA